MHKAIWKKKKLIEKAGIISKPIGLPDIGVIRHSFSEYICKTFKEVQDKIKYISKDKVEAEGNWWRSEWKSHWLPPRANLELQLNCGETTQNKQLGNRQREVNNFKHTEPALAQLVW